MLVVIASSRKLGRGDKIARLVMQGKALTKTVTLRFYKRQMEESDRGMQRMVEMYSCFDASILVLCPIVVEWRQLWDFAMLHSSSLTVYQCLGMSVHTVVTSMTMVAKVRTDAKSSTHVRSRKRVATNAIPLLPGSLI